jgi:hypothetical protein
MALLFLLSSPSPVLLPTLISLPSNLFVFNECITSIIIIAICVHTTHPPYSFLWLNGLDYLIKLKWSIVNSCFLIVVVPYCLFNVGAYRPTGGSYRTCQLHRQQ